MTRRELCPSNVSARHRRLAELSFFDLSGGCLCHDTGIGDHAREKKIGGAPAWNVLLHKFLPCKASIFA